MPQWRFIQELVVENSNGDMTNTDNSGDANIWFWNLQDLSDPLSTSFRPQYTTFGRKPCIKSWYLLQNMQTWWISGFKKSPVEPDAPWSPCFPLSPSNSCQIGGFGARTGCALEAVPVVFPFKMAVLQATFLMLFSRKVSRFLTYQHGCLLTSQTG